LGIESRKRDHIQISLDKDVSFKEKTNWFEYVELIHSALPEMDADEVNLSTTFLGEKFSLPFVIEGMTGGTEEAEKINGNLSEAAATAKIPVGVGSQRAAMVKPELAKTFRAARERAPGAFILANIGGVQIAEHGPDMALRAVQMIDADALVIHLNPLQEVVQPDGKANFRNLISRIRRLRRELGLPIIVKEIGCGMSGNAAKRLEEAGVDAIDVAGSGGTNWTLIEMMRAEGAGDEAKAHLAEALLEWGIPTAASTLEVRASTSLPIISSGGIRSGLEAAKALALGADMVGFAHPMLEPATRSAEAVLAKIRQLEQELRTVMFLSSAKTVERMKAADLVLLGPLYQWAVQRCAAHPKLRQAYSWAKTKRIREPLSRRQKPKRSN